MSSGRATQSHGFVDRVLERRLPASTLRTSAPRSRIRNTFRPDAMSSDPMLTFEAKQRGGGGAGAVLSSAGLGDDALLSSGQPAAPDRARC